MPEASWIAVRIELLRNVVQQLHAQIEIIDANPGTTVRISHTVAIAGVAQAIPIARAV